MAWTSGRSFCRCRMWASESPLPTGGIPWRVSQVSNTPSRPSSSHEWSVPRLSCQSTMSATGAASASTGTIDEYWLQHPMTATSLAADGAAAAASAMLSFTAFRFTPTVG